MGEWFAKNYRAGWIGFAGCLAVLAFLYGNPRMIKTTETKWKVRTVYKSGARFNVKGVAGTKATIDKDGTLKLEGPFDLSGSSYSASDTTSEGESKTEERPVDWRFQVKASLLNPVTKIDPRFRVSLDYKAGRLLMLDLIAGADAEVPIGAITVTDLAREARVRVSAAWRF